MGKKTVIRLKELAAEKGPLAEIPQEDDRPSDFS